MPKRRRWVHRNEWAPSQFRFFIVSPGSIALAQYLLPSSSGAGRVAAIIAGMKNPAFSLRKEDIVLSDPEALADRLAEFLRAHVQPDDADRDLILLFVDRLFLGFCDDFSDEELMRGVQVDFPGLRKEQVASLRTMQGKSRAGAAMAAEAGR